MSLLLNYYTEPINAEFCIYDSYAVGKKFKSSTYFPNNDFTVDCIKFYLRRDGNPSSVIFKLYKTLPYDPGFVSPPLITISIPTEDIPTEYPYMYKCIFPYEVKLYCDYYYFFAVSIIGGSSGTDCCYLGYYYDGNPAHGDMSYSGNYGSSFGISTGYPQFELRGTPEIRWPTLTSVCISGIANTLIKTTGNATFDGVTD